MVFNKIDAYSYLPKDADDLSPTEKINYSLDDWRKTWMAKTHRASSSLLSTETTIKSSEPCCTMR